ncbi:hypothetical protein B0H15DRAFT_954991 [Mycena belliarum]|uniref:Uncharacterized protein n=1 Tax=Mycena belliarum TaxID=1033014 RepID=A0AAD6TSG1_9AGAR|nr:hypothetical protein B0H15DRAFT_954991 [Mycena belliae]
MPRLRNAPAASRARFLDAVARAGFAYGVQHSRGFVRAQCTADAHPCPAQERRHACSLRRRALGCEFALMHSYSGTLAQAGEVSACRARIDTRAFAWCSVRAAY